MSVGRLTSGSFAHECDFSSADCIHKVAVGLHADAERVCVVRFTSRPSAESGRTAVEPVLL